MIRNQVVDPLFPQCPVRNVLSRIGDRWSLLVLLALHEKAEGGWWSSVPDHLSRGAAACGIQADEARKDAHPTAQSVGGLVVGQHGCHHKAPREIWIVVSGPQNGCYPKNLIVRLVSANHKLRRYFILIIEPVRQVNHKVWRSPHNCVAVAIQLCGGSHPTVWR